MVQITVVQQEADLEQETHNISQDGSQFTAQIVRNVEDMGGVIHVEVCQHRVNITCRLM